MRKLVHAVVFPLIVTFILSVLAATTMSPGVLHDMGNSSQWTEFASGVSVRVSATDTPTRIVLLLCLHAMHIYMCLPMLHVTKVLYGLWLGVWIGWSLCCVWELLLLYVYIHSIKIERHDVMFAYIDSARQAGTLIRENVLLAMSSLPLQASASLVQFGGVTNTEFMTANTIVTILMSLKNVSCGAILASSPGTHTVVMVSAVLVFSTVLPTCSTVYVTSKTVLVALTTHDEHQALLTVDESIHDMECDGVHAHFEVDVADACSLNPERENAGAVFNTDAAEASPVDIENDIESPQFTTVDAVEATALPTVNCIVHENLYGHDHDIERVSLTANETRIHGDERIDTC